jgi:thiol:disulfide interchange protein DsbC
MSQSRSLLGVGALSLAALLATVVTALYAPAPAAQATATPSAPGGVDLGAVASKIRQQFPDLAVDAVRLSPMPGLLEVVSGHRVLYSDPSGSFLITGHLIDAQSKIDLTERADLDLSRIDPKTLPLADSFAEVRGNGKRQLYVFSDPDCPYCRRLEKEFPKLNDVTIHVFLYPLESIHPNSRTNAVAVWCAKDRLKAWETKMRDDTVPHAPICDNPIDRNIALGEKFGFTGTPTIVFSDGRVYAGARPAEQIDQLMSAAN